MHVEVNDGSGRHAVIAVMTSARNERAESDRCPKQKTNQGRGETEEEFTPEVSGEDFSTLG
jgi:hypothetical protein